MERYITDIIEFTGTRPKLFEGTKKYISTGALILSNIDNNAVELVEYHSRPSRADLEVNPGDLVFAKMSNTDKRLIINEEISKNIYSTGFFAVKAKNCVITTKCLYYLLGSKSFLDQKDKNSTGATQRAITIYGLSKIKIRISDFINQKNIEKVLESVDTIIQLRKKQINEYDQLIKSRFVEMFGDPILNQKGWKTEKLQTVCAVNKYKGEVENTNGKVWLLNLDMVESNTGRIIDYVYEDEDNIASSTITFDTNCVLYSKLRPYLNKVVVPLKSGYATSEMISMKTNNVNKYFLSNLLMMNSFVDFANGTSYGAKMPRASVDMIKNFDLMLPPKTLQEDFALFFEQVDKLKFENELLYCKNRFTRIKQTKLVC